VAGYSGDAGNALAAAQQPNWNANGMKFTTLDQDNDLWTGNCAIGHGGTGWWLNACSANFLNSALLTFYGTGSLVYDVQASRMLVKLN